MILLKLGVSMLAVPVGCRSQLIDIPPGSELLVEDSPLSGLQPAAEVKVGWQGEWYLVFAIDLLTRAEVIGAGR